MKATKTIKLLIEKCELGAEVHKNRFATIIFIDE